MGKTIEKCRRFDATTALRLGISALISGAMARQLHRDVSFPTARVFSAGKGGRL
jgi:hypothetical protein